MALHLRVFLLVVLFLPTQLGLHFWPQWAAVLGRNVDYLSPAIYFTDILIVVLLLLWAREYISTFKSNKSLEAGKAYLKQYAYPLVLLGLFTALNIVISHRPQIALYQWIKVYEFGFLALYVVQTKPSRVLVLGSLSIAVLYSSVIAIVQFLLQHSIGGPLWWIGERSFSLDTPGIARVAWCIGGLHWCPELVRPYATFPHPNVLAGFLVSALPALFYGRIQQSFTPAYHLLLRCSIACGVAALIVTFSRSAWIVFGITMILLMKHGLLQQSKKRTLYVGGGLLILCLVIVFLLSGLIDSDSVLLRHQLNMAAIKMVENNILFGVGLGNFLVELPHYIASRGVFFLQPVHNIYLLLLAELGVLGGCVLALFFLEYKRHIGNFYAFRIPLLGLFMLGFVDHYLVTLQQGQLLITLFLALSLSRVRK